MGGVLATSRVASKRQSVQRRGKSRRRSRASRPDDVLMLPLGGLLSESAAAATPRPNRLVPGGVLRRAVAKGAAAAPAVGGASSSRTPLQPRFAQELSQARGSGGEALPRSVRTFTEPLFAQDFRDVRVHTGGAAGELNRSVRARAFTVGNDIFFSRGAFRPDSTDGRRLLVHELTHVAQQRHGRVQGQVLQRDPALPDEAFPRCAMDPPVPSAEMPSADEWFSHPVLNRIRAERPGENDTLLSRSRGSEGEAVHLVQQALVAWGCDRIARNLLPRSGVDADFGKETKAAVEKFQGTVGGLTEDGVIGPLTLAKLDDVLFGRSEESAEAGAEVPVPESGCRPTNAAFAPSSSNCAFYQSPIARRFLTFTYRNNAACACENTPDDPKNNCVRACLQDELRSFLGFLNRSGAAIGACIDPLGILNPICPEPFCSQIHRQHVDCFRDCCCDAQFINFPVFATMCQVPFPCSFVGTSIEVFNACR